MKKLLALSLALVMVLMTFAGCGNSTPPASGNSGSGSDTATPAGPKEVIINLGSEPPEMSSIRTTSTGSMNVLRHIVEGLTMLDQQDVPVPAVAESWDYDEATLTYTFHLRKDYKWNNGEPVTAKDFIFAWDTFFSFETAADYAGTWAPLILGAKERMNTLTDEQYAAIEDADIKASIDKAKPTPEFLADMAAKGYESGIGYKAVDDYTVQVTLTTPCPYFLSVMAFPSFLPVNEALYNEMGGLESYGTEADKIATNGPFNLTEWKHEDSLVLEKNADYPMANDIKLDKITMMMISDTGTAFNSFLAGEIDMIGLNGDQAQAMKDQGKNVLFYDDGSCWYFEYQTTQKGLNNKKVRQALTMAMDAQLFVETVVKNNSSVAYSFVPPAISNGEFTAKVGKVINRVTDGDYSKVKALFDEGLKEEGLTADQFKLAIITDEGDTAAKNCAFFQEQWKTHLGIEVSVEQMTYKNRLERMTNKDFSVVLAGWGPDYNDPMTFLDLFVTGNGNNHTSYSNPEYDKLVAAAMAEPDAAKRDEILVSIEKVLMDDMPVGPIYNRARDYICSDRLTGVVRTAFADMNFRWCDVVA